MGRGKNDVRRQCKKFRRRGRGASDVWRPSRIDYHVVSIDPPEVLECRPKGCRVGAPKIALIESHKHTNAPRPLALLRTRCEGPCRHANERNKLSPSHGSLILKSTPYHIVE